MTGLWQHGPVIFPKRVGASLEVMRSRSSIAVVVVSLTASALVGGSLASGSEAAGVAGQVLTRQTSGAGCVRAPCYRPVAGVSVTLTGVRTVHVRTDRAGRFRVVLEPGQWVAHAPRLVSLNRAGIPFRVVPGRFRKLTLVVATQASDHGEPTGRV